MGIDADCLIEIRNRFLMSVKHAFSVSSVVVGYSKLGIEANCLVIIGNGIVVLAQEQPWRFLYYSRFGYLGD